MNNITVTEKQINYLEDVVYNGLQPSGGSIGGGGNQSDLYYSKIQLDAGQLDNRYYTETELNTKFGLYYTKVNLDGGQLDNRYYRETEVNTWRNSVTQTEMGYLHGATPITSNVQAQITARAIISGTPADNQLAVWVDANTIEGTSGLIFNAGNLQIKEATPEFWIRTDIGSDNIKVGEIRFIADVAARNARIEGYRWGNSELMGLKFYTYKSSAEVEAMTINYLGYVE